jgi:hypothetical protein
MCENEPDFGCEAWLYHRSRKLPAIEEIEKLNTNTAWGSPIATRNVLFTPL